MDYAGPDDDHDDCSGHSLRQLHLGSGAVLLTVHATADLRLHSVADVQDQPAGDDLRLELEGVVGNERGRGVQIAGNPTSEHDWTVHAINIHGVFFERWCQKVVSETPGWSLDSTNYPVEFPPPNGPIRGKESTLDIRASSREGDSVTVLPVECKKNNPDFINWIFFKKFRPPRDLFNISQVENTPRDPPTVGWSTSSSIRTVQAVSSLPLGDEGRETRGTYSAYSAKDKTKTSNAAIQDAAYQVALATQAIAQEDSSVSERLGMRGTIPMPWRIKVYLPTIVTTAKLFVCDFDPGNVDPASGEVPFGKTTLTEVPQLIFEYTLPRHLQFGPAELGQAYGEGLVDMFTRMHVMVIQSNHFPTVLKAITRGSLWATTVPSAKPAGS